MTTGEGDLARLERTLEAIRENYATLRDVDRRFLEDRARLTNLEGNLGLNYKFQTEVIDKLNTLLEVKIEKSMQPMVEDIKELQKDIKELKQRKTDDLQWNIRQIITIFVGFLLSGGALGAIQFLLGLIRK